MNTPPVDIVPLFPPTENVVNTLPPVNVNPPPYVHVLNTPLGMIRQHNPGFLTEDQLRHLGQDQQVRREFEENEAREEADRREHEAMYEEYLRNNWFDIDNSDYSDGYNTP